ncbi:MAG: right-handed parallel beta-helix repeat-containing protein [Candidatus Heimdallarchaeum endolithica]|uniref:Right-handed parallel beta-helix repeat-containing protein n=1 Tax=Candidatus Heimdallarchaeum endolithica TaxID=2876572 RepID=A0A9Y1BTL3_9ARCH|nr:MAG: right-handed parallel beta-helix repeat-containing protein [Candidatus Heimdallarchaeum endolithica]
MSYDFPGSGTEDEPYIIEDYSIITSSYYGIYICNITKNFIIRNCYIDARSIGINIENVQSGVITIANNTCINNNYKGISFNSLSYTIATFFNNTCENSDCGIYLHSSDNANLTMNTCNNNNHGIYLYSSDNVYLNGNSFLNNGLFIQGDLENFLSIKAFNNYVNGKPLGYFTNLNGIVISESIYGQLFIINCTDIIIRNQVIFNTTTGITTNFLQNVSFTNNTCNNNFYSGIFLSSSSNVTFANNTCNSNYNNGIFLSSSNNVTFTNNTCNSNYDNGIFLSSSSNVTFTNNTCENNYNFGICISYSDYSMIVNNTCINNHDGSIFLLYSININLINNTFCGGGLYISGNLDNFLSIKAFNNYVNGKPLGYFTNLNGIVISESNYGQLFIINSTNTIISNQILTNVVAGLTVLYSQNTTLANNTCNNNWFGISLSYSTNITFVNNTCNYNRFGIVLSFSEKNILANNTCNNNEDKGISIVYSDNIVFTNNTCNMNEYGVFIYQSTNIILTNNYCFYGHFGIELSFNVNLSIISNNVLFKNLGYGLVLKFSFNNTIFGNNFIHNNLGKISQAYDDTENNCWYNIDKLQGNYWSDWNDTSENYFIEPGLTFDKYPQTPLDNDSDELYDILELLLYSTDPLDSDTDSDGIPDGWEVENNLDPLTDDAKEDFDSDGLTNLGEFQYSTDPLDSDTDDDDLTDGQEVNTYFTDPLDSDTDDDDLTDGQEVNTYLTDPLDSDTDDDSMPDGWEVEYKLNPLYRDSFLDPDIDDLSNLGEYQNSTDPLDSDTDGDGKFDGWEVEKGKSPVEENIYLTIVEKIGYFIILPLFIVTVVFIINKLRMKIKTKKKLERLIYLQSELDEKYKEYLANISLLIVLVSSVQEVRNYLEKLGILLENLSFVRSNIKKLKTNEQAQFNEIYEEIFSFISTTLHDKIVSLIEVINSTNLEEYTKEVLAKLISDWSDKEFKPLIISYEEILSILNYIVAFIEHKTFTKFASSEPLWSDIKDLATEKLSIVQKLMEKNEQLLAELTKIINDAENNNMKLERLKKVSSVYNKISLTKLSPLLNFEDLEIMKLWLYAYSKDVPNRIEGEEVIFDLQFEGEFVAEDMTTAIDDLLQQFSEWERTGKGKKK